MCEGVKGGKHEQIESEDVQDEQATTLRTMFVAKIGNIAGEINVIDITIDFLNAAQDCKVYYTKPTGEKTFKKFVL